MSKRSGVIAFLAIFLSACGGGGGGGEHILHVSLSYPSTGIPIFQQVSVQPQLGGFEGHAPQCTLVSGAVPPGMTVGGDCVLSGRPAQPGIFDFELQVGADGASNTIDVGASAVVTGPMVTYTSRTFAPALSVGDTVNDTPTVMNWTSSSDVNMSWRYSIVNGTLPTGLTLDPSTGRISGTAQSNGIFSADIQATLTTQFGVFQPTITTYAANVNVPYIGYGSSDQLTVYVSQPVSLSPGAVGAYLPPTATITNPVFQPSLPAGLSVDAATGVISGVPTGITASPYNVQATLTNGGISVATQGAFSLSVSSPVNYSYGSLPFHTIYATAGSAVSLTPVVTQVSPVALSPSATATYAQRADSCSLAPGLSFNPNTGVVSGTPSAAGTFSCFIDVSVTNNAITWSAHTQLYMVVQ